MTVAEEAAVVGSEPPHVRSFDIGGQRLGLAVGRFDGFGDAEVFVGDGAVRDPRVGEGHAHRSMPEQRGDRSRLMPRLIACVASVWRS